MGHAGGGVVPSAVQLELHVHAAVIGGEKGVALLVVRFGHHIDVQAVFQYGVDHLFSDFGVFLVYHGPHASLPFKK